MKIYGVFLNIYDTTPNGICDESKEPRILINGIYWPYKRAIKKFKKVIDSLTGDKEHSRSYMIGSRWAALPLGDDDRIAQKDNPQSKWCYVHVEELVLNRSYE